MNKCLCDLHINAVSNIAKLTLRKQINSNSSYLCLLYFYGSQFTVETYCFADDRCLPLESV